jgi:hypothetical protein
MEDVKESPGPVFIFQPSADTAYSTTTASAAVAQTVVVHTRPPESGHHVEAKIAMPPAPAPTFIPTREHELGFEWVIAAPSLAAITVVYVLRV